MGEKTMEMSNCEERMQSSVVHERKREKRSKVATKGEKGLDEGPRHLWKKNAKPGEKGPNWSKEDNFIFSMTGCG